MYLSLSSCDKHVITHHLGNILYGTISPTGVPHRGRMSTEGQGFRLLPGIQSESTTKKVVTSASSQCGYAGSVRKPFLTLCSSFFSSRSHSFNKRTERELEKRCAVIAKIKDIYFIKKKFKLTANVCTYYQVPFFF